MTHDSSTAVILIAHGSRRPEANDDVRQLAQELTALDEYALVEVAYLELAAPAIPEAAATCVARGARRVLLMPYFLSAGTHVVDDLRTLRIELAGSHPGITFELCPPLGLHPRMLEIVRDRLHERLG